MIVISGALVLVALVLLIIGVVGPDLTFVYASIAVSLVSLVFLVIGILQRRGESAPAADAKAAQPAPADRDEDKADSVTAVIPAQSTRVSMAKPDDAPEQPAPVADTVDEELETGGTVLIVEGRPRYHVDGCRYLTNKTAEKIDVLDAREEGFSPCGVCKPDDALEALSAESYEEEPLDEEPLDEEPLEEEPVVEEDVPGVEVTPARKRAPAKKAAAKKAPAKKVTSTRAATATSTKAPAKAASKAPSKSAAKAAAAATAATPAAATAKKTGSVVVIPDRGKFHRGECRYVRDVDGAESMTKTAASRQGYAACGVCKP